MKDIVAKREKGKVEASSSYCFKPFSASMHAVGVNQVAGLPKIQIDEEGPGLSAGDQVALAEHIQGNTGWGCPVFYFYCNGHLVENLGSREPGEIHGNRRR
jgi:hypothetical protein